MDLNRKCPVCGIFNKSFLMQQSFTEMSHASLLSSYKVAVCKGCGAAFADVIPEQKIFDHYYSEMSKYEFPQNGGVQSPTDLARFKEIADFVEPYLKLNFHILDMGCATGGLLAEMKKRGYRNLLGVDPSNLCCEMTKSLYDIKTIRSTISNMDKLDTKFDFLFLIGVLEHLKDINSALRGLASCMSSEGLIYIEVPDATSYDQFQGAPFQFFSIEHINFLSPQSLRNLMANHGFECIFTEKIIRYLSPNAIEPAIGGLFRLRTKVDRLENVEFDFETLPALERYISRSRELESTVFAQIDQLVDAGRPLAVWGVGAHTLRLLTSSRLGKANLVAFIDSNIKYKGNFIAEIPVVPPSDFNGVDVEILISSYVSENEIFQTITQNLCWPNRIHRLYLN